MLYQGPSASHYDLHADAITDAFGLRQGDYMVHAPCAPIQDLFCEGRCVGSAWGILPVCLQGCRAVFVDPRPVAMLALPPIPYAVSGVLGLISAHRPEHLSFSSRETPRIEDQAEDGMLITFSVDDDTQPRAPEAASLRIGHSMQPHEEAPASGDRNVTSSRALGLSDRDAGSSSRRAGPPAILSILIGSVAGPHGPPFTPAPIWGWRQRLNLPACGTGGLVLTHWYSAPPETPLPKGQLNICRC